MKKIILFQFGPLIPAPLFSLPTHPIKFHITILPLINSKNPNLVFLHLPPPSCTSICFFLHRVLVASHLPLDLAWAWFSWKKEPACKSVHLLQSSWKKEPQSNLKDITRFRNIFYNGFSKLIKQFFFKKPITKNVFWPHNTFCIWNSIIDFLLCILCSLFWKIFITCRYTMRTRGGVQAKMVQDKTNCFGA